MAAPRATSRQPLPAEAWVVGRSFSGAQLSPDGNLVSYLARAGKLSHLAVMSTSGAPEQTLPLVPPPSGGGHSWLPSGTGLVYTAADGRLYKFDLDALRSRPLTPVRQQASNPVVSPDGSNVAYVVDDMAGIAIVSIEETTSWPRLVSGEDDFATDPAWSPDGESVAWVTWNDPDMPWDSSRILLRSVDGDARPQTVAGGDGVSVQQPRFSPDGARLAFLSDETGWLNLWVVDLPGLEHRRPMVEETFEHGEPQWGPGQRSYTWSGDDIAFVRNEHGWSRLLKCDGLTGEVQPISETGATDVVGDAEQVVALTSGPVTPVQLVSYDLPSRSTVTLTRSTPFGIERRLKEPELVSWTATDGSEIHGRLYRNGDGPAPMLVWTHVGPTAQSAATIYHRFAYFLERGWSLLVPDHRGSTGWGRAYLQAMRGRWGELDVNDVAAGVRAAVDNGWCVPSKVVPIGGSAGGFTTLLLLAKHSELFAAGVTMYPVCDLFDLNWTTHRFEARYNDSLVGPLPDAYDEFVARSPLTNAEEICAPLLVLHGSSDQVVPVKQSEDLVARVKRNGVHAQLHIYDGEGHGWRSFDTRVDELSRIDTFLRKHVLHLGPDPDESKEMS